MPGIRLQWFTKVGVLRDLGTSCCVKLVMVVVNLIKNSQKAFQLLITINYYEIHCKIDKKLNTRKLVK